MPVICVIGATNAGKTTFIDRLCQHPSFEGVFVGRMMRAKYPPEYFEGLGALDKTEPEVISMMCEGINKAVEAMKIPVLDGQPRSMRQIEMLCRVYPKDHGVLPIFVHLYAPPHVRNLRMEERDAGGDLALSKARSVNDTSFLYDLLQMLQDQCHRVIRVRTDRPHEVTTVLRGISTEFGGAPWQFEI